MREIGLFPLNVVLFPESALPLHIFEGKYKNLINSCIDNNKEFGVVLNDYGKMSFVGCAARVLDILKKYSDGRMDIMVQGTSKFKILKVSEDTNHYKVAGIEAYEDDNEKTNLALLDQLVELYNKISESVDTIQIAKLDSRNLNTELPSYFIAQKSGLTNLQKQELLDKTSENMRLFYLLDHLKKLVPMIKETETIKKIIRNDGYHQFKSM